MTPLALGLIGCGNIARCAHLPAMPGLADRVRLVAVVAVDEAAARAAATTWGATAHADWCAVLDRPDIEAVLIATPEYPHADPGSRSSAG
jgi:predicted dehydrogenase